MQVGRRISSFVAVSCAVLALVHVGCGRGGFSKSVKRIQIVEEGVGPASPIENTRIEIGDSLTLRGALFDQDEYVSDIDVVWSLVGSSFPSADLTPIYSSSVLATFTPSMLGTVIIMASSIDLRSDITERTDVTGGITVASDRISASVLMVGGNDQTGVVGNELPVPLEVRIFDTYGLAIVGVDVRFSVVQGDGGIVGDNPAIANIMGIAGCSVTLGTKAGLQSDMFRATVVADESLTVDFFATATPGAADHLELTVNPASAFENAPFAVQPVVTLADAFGNPVALSGLVTLSVSTGTGSLTGDTQAPLVQGVATFVDVGYDKAESGVVIRADSDGGIEGLSDPFTVQASPPGACSRNDGRFTTAGGGCTDLATRLVWSAIAPSKRWSEAVWDATFSGSDFADVYDLGRSNDYPAGSGCPGSCDNNVQGYCHALQEGGQSDWRMPAIGEVYDLFWNIDAGDPPYLANFTGKTLYSASTYSTDPTQAYIVETSGSTNRRTKSTYSYPFYCVRGNRSDPDHIAVSSGPAAMGAGFTPRSSLIVQIRDSVGAGVSIEGVAVDLVSASIGSLGGTLTAQTNNGGRATFSDWTLDTEGEVTVTIDAIGFGQTTHDVWVAAAPNRCLFEDSFFETAEGGCRHKVTGLSWSLISPAGMNWYEAVWGYHGPSTNVVPDVDDRGCTNDYNNYPGTLDTSMTNYCHELVEGGYWDWRLPTRDELYEVANEGNGAAVYFGFDTTQYFWSSTSGSTGDAYRVYLSTGTYGGVSKTSYQHRVVCVRQTQSFADHLSVVSGPVVMGTGFVPHNPLVIQVREASGAPIHAEAVELALVSVSLGSLSGTLTATTDYRGRVSFADWTLDTEGANVVTIGMTDLGWLNLISPTGALASATYDVTVGAAPHTCIVEDAAFQTADGGCKYLVPLNGKLLVWSHPSVSTMNWHEGVWGSTATFNRQPDAGDGVRVDDYGNDPGSSPDNSTVNYCHELEEGGYIDWRAATRDELYEVANAGNGAAVHFYFDTDQYFWSSTTASTGDAYRVYLSTGTYGGVSKAPYNYRFICVRESI